VAAAEPESVTKKASAERATTRRAAATPARKSAARSRRPVKRETATPVPPPRPRDRLRRIGVAAAVVATVIAAESAVALSLLRGDSDKIRTGVATEVSVEQMRAFADSLGRAVYWAGPRPHTRLELTRTQEGRIFVRYLPKNAPVGDRRPRYTTVATYPLRDAYAVAVREAQKPAMVRANAPVGGIAVWSKRRATSVYLAYPGTHALVEVFDPVAGRAPRLALSGAVGPIR
jgi:hypothetical protein